jgi:hypothetical protein
VREVEGSKERKVSEASAEDVNRKMEKLMSNDPEIRIIDILQKALGTFRKVSAFGNLGM